jgi:hypothetical protein
MIAAGNRRAQKDGSAAKPTQHEESAMSNPSRRALNTTLKVAALVAALGFVTVMLEHPRLTASPSMPTSTDAGAALMNVTYFPSQFAPPSGEIEPQPTTF